MRRHSDIARAKRENKVGVMYGFQYTSFLEQDPERIDTFRRLGVRIMQLTYNNRSIFGDGCLEPGNAGLSKAGDRCRQENERCRCRRRPQSQRISHHLRRHLCVEEARPDITRGMLGRSTLIPATSPTKS